MRIKMFFLLFWVLSFQHLQADTSVEIGEKSPDIEFRSILNFVRSSARLSDFRSRAVIIDFWGTWCSSCIEGFPHLDSLQSRFRKDLQVLTVTDEPKERIQRYLTHHAMSLPVAIDTSGSIREFFPHNTVPHAVLIDKSGVVRAITSPEKLTEKVIKDLIAGESIEIPVKVDVQMKNPSGAFALDDNIQFLTLVEPYREDLPSGFSPIGVEKFYLRSVLASNEPISSLFESAYEFPRNSRTVIQVRDFAKLRSDKFCFVQIVPEEEGPKRLQIMRQQLEQVFPYKAQIVEKMLPVKLLKIVAGSRLSLTAKHESNEPRLAITTGQGLELKNSAIEGVAKFAESRLKLPVLNETGLTDRYDLTIESYEDESMNLNQELRKLGLELVDAQRVIQVLVITDK